MRKGSNKMVDVCSGEELKEGGRGKVLDRCVEERKWGREKEIHAGDKKSGGNNQNLKFENLKI